MSCVCQKLRFSEMLLSLAIFCVLLGSGDSRTILAKEEGIQERGSADQSDMLSPILSLEGLSKGTIRLLKDAIVVSKLIVEPAFHIGSAPLPTPHDTHPRKSRYPVLLHGTQLETIVMIAAVPESPTFKSIRYTTCFGEAYVVALSDSERAIAIGRQTGIGGWSFKDFAYIATRAEITHKNTSGQEFRIFARQYPDGRWGPDWRVDVWKAKEAHIEGKIIARVPKATIDDPGIYSAFYSLESSVIYNENRNLIAVLIGKDKNYALHIPTDATVTESFTVNARQVDLTTGERVSVPESTLQKGSYLSFNGQHSAFLFDKDKGRIVGALIGEGERSQFYLATEARVAQASADSSLKQGVYEVLIGSESVVLLDKAGKPVRILKQ